MIKHQEKIDFINNTDLIPGPLKVFETEKDMVFFFALSIVAAYDKPILINSLAVVYNANIIIASLLLGSFYLIKTPIIKEAYFN